MIDIDSLCEQGKRVIAIEARAILQLAERIDDHFVTACKYLLNGKGRTIVLGMGKSGHIAKKIAATLASTGTPAFYVHPAEASHGDMGMITAEDVVLAISYSGETPEVVSILPLITGLKIPVIAMTGNAQSTLSRLSTVTLDIGVSEEACPLGLAPTSSTTATLVMGDALAIALLEARGFTANDFAKVHPGGMLGRRLLLKVEDLMHTGDAIPIVSPNCRLDEALFEITQKSLGMTTVTDDSGRLVGIFTDGDLRRTLDRGFDIHKTIMDEVMTKTNFIIKPKMLAAEAFELMKQHKITSLVVIDDQNQLQGVIHMHDLLRAGMR